MFELQVEGMTCGGCAASVKRAVQRLDGKAEVEVDLAHGQVRVRSTADRAAVQSAISDAGFDVTGVRPLG